MKLEPVNFWDSSDIGFEVDTWLAAPSAQRPQLAPSFPRENTDLIISFPTWFTPEPQVRSYLGSGGAQPPPPPEEEGSRGAGGHKLRGAKLLKARRTPRAVGRKEENPR